MDILYYDGLESISQGLAEFLELAGVICDLVLELELAAFALFRLGIPFHLREVRIFEDIFLEVAQVHWLLDAKNDEKAVLLNDLLQH